MTSFRELFKQVNREKWSIVLGVFAVIILLQGLDYLAYFLNVNILNLGSLNTTGLSSGMNGILLYFLLARQERVWRQNRFRLIPEVESRLYAANLLGTSAIMSLLFVLDLINVGIRAMVLGQGVVEFNAPLSAFIVTALLVAGILLLLLPAIVSFIHMGVLALIDVLPWRGGRGVSVLVAILIFLATAALLGFLGSFVFWFMPNNDMNAQIRWMLVVVPLLTVALFAVLTVSNLALLKRAIETSK